MSEPDGSLPPMLPDAPYDIPMYARLEHCLFEACDAPIYWIFTKLGARIAVDPDGIPHAETCANNRKW